jgi:hypothetical protein
MIVATMMGRAVLVVIVVVMATMAVVVAMVDGVASAYGGRSVHFLCA